MKLAIFFHSALLCFLMLQTACVGKKNDSFPTLLQGKWQHIDDKTNFLIFEGNKRKEMAEGMEEWDVEEIIISDQCKNNSNPGSDPNQEKGFYISALTSDLCWYISFVDEETLSLIYMGRGNTLTYKRVRLK